LADFPTETHRFESFDGTEIAWHEGGEGRPLLLIHGYFSDAYTNWIRYGHAAKIAAKGYRVIMPDLRAHGLSARPHDPSAYPSDALALDGEALVAHLGLTDYDLAGYSLGGRTAVRMVARGAAPTKLVVAGMGLEGLTGTSGRAGHFRNILTNLGKHERGTPEWLAEAFLKTTKGDPVALLGILDTFIDTSREAIAAITQRTLVVAGEEDSDNGSHEALAALVPNATLAEVPGGHMSAVTKPELGQAIADFLGA
jgi:pimeloyl-ACP methyl ester carboxylesterase